MNIQNMNKKTRKQGVECQTETHLKRRCLCDTTVLYMYVVGLSLLAFTSLIP